MTNPEERRHARRIVVGPDHCVRFLVRGHLFRDVRITNLSAGGCFALVHHRDGGLFRADTLLEQFAFQHPELAGDPFTARVTYVLGGAPGKEGLDVLGLGLQFVAPGEALKAALRRHLDTLLSGG